MPVKPAAAVLPLKEQIFEIPGGLTIQLLASEAEDAPYRLILHGDALPFGSYEVLFNAEGEEAGGGTALTGSCRPSWLRELR